VRYRQNIKSGLGAQADLRLTAGLFSQGGINAGVFGQLTWSDAKASQSYFGLTPQQAAVSGLPVYSASAGLRFAAVGILGSVDVSTHWLILWGEACSDWPARRAIRRSCRTARTGTQMPVWPIAFERGESDPPRPGQSRSLSRH
jgi:MltA-interacting protein MipA